MPPPRHPPPPPPMPPLGASAGASADAFADASANVPAGAAVALLGSQPASRTPNAPKYPACFFASEGKLMISARFLKHFGSACAFRSVATRVSWPLMLETSLYVTFGARSRNLSEVAQMQPMLASLGPGPFCVRLMVFQ